MVTTVKTMISTDTVILQIVTFSDAYIFLERQRISKRVLMFLDCMMGYENGVCLLENLSSPLTRRVLCWELAHLKLDYEVDQQFCSTCLMLLGIIL